jgi:hypothetical protein
MGSIAAIPNEVNRLVDVSTTLGRSSKSGGNVEGSIAAKSTAIGTTDSRGWGLRRAAAGTGDLMTHRIKFGLRG